MITSGPENGIRWVDDSKATNPHAAASSLRAFDSIVWVAGGQAKGTTFDDLVQTYGDKLRGVVLLGVDRQVIADALARHAPQIPVTIIDSTDTGAMTQAVQAAWLALADAASAILTCQGRVSPA